MMEVAQRRGGVWTDTRDRTVGEASFTCGFDMEEFSWCVVNLLRRCNFGGRTSF